MDHAKKKLVTWFYSNLGRDKNGTIQGQVHGQGVLIGQIFIHEQMGISNERAVDVTNATSHEAKTTLKKIVGPHAFVENK